MSPGQACPAVLADYYETRINAERRARNLATALQAVTGQKIIIQARGLT